MPTSPPSKLIRDAAATLTNHCRLVPDIEDPTGIVLTLTTLRHLQAVLTSAGDLLATKLAALSQEGA